MPRHPEKILHSSQPGYKQLWFPWEHRIRQLQELFYYPAPCSFTLNSHSLVSTKGSKFPLKQIAGATFCVAFISPGLWLPPPHSKLHVPKLWSLFPKLRGCHALCGSASCPGIQKCLQEESQGNCRVHLIFPLLLRIILHCLCTMVENSFFIYFVQFCNSLWQKAISISATRSWPEMEKSHF